MEKEFAGYTYAHPRPSVTATIFAFHEAKGLLVGRRSIESDAFPGCLCAPGGFLDAKVEGDRHRRGETIEETAQREFSEETGVLIAEQDRFQMFHVHSDPGTDPRAHVVNICFLIALDDQEAQSVQAADDLDSLIWMPLAEVLSAKNEWAFNHHNLALIAVNKHLLKDWVTSQETGYPDHGERFP